MKNEHTQHKNTMNVDEGIVANLNPKFQILLTLLCTQAVEEKLLDSLLMLPQISVFTSTESAAHGLDSSNMSAMEQVMGRAKVMQIQVLLTEQDKAVVMDKLKTEFANTHIRYWVSPILEEGVLS